MTTILLPSGATPSPGPRDPDSPPVPAAWAQISTTTLTDRVYAALRDGILRGRHGAGEFVREEDVSRSLGVSRTPVREALARLAREGFLEHIARRGFRVPRESIQRLLDLYPIVCTLELLAGEAAFPKLTADDIARLREINQRCLEATERQDTRASIEWNNQFHHVLSERCGNDRLCALLDELRAQVLRLEFWSAEHPGHVYEATSQHEEIVREIEQGRFAEALAILKLNRLSTLTEFQTEIGVGS